jgi:metal-sulfur cluster biosynthetic enzyme
VSSEARNAHANEVREAFRVVIDPELGESVVDLGLIYAVAVEDGGVARVEMTTTTRGCPATAYLKDAVQSAAWNVAGIRYVDVRLTYEPPWTPEMMNGTARRRLGMARARRHA